MDENEANRIAEAIRQFGRLKVLAVSRNPMTQSYEIRCDYNGPTLRRNNIILVGGIALWIKSPGDWVKTHMVLEHGQEEKK